MGVQTNFAECPAYVHVLTTIIIIKKCGQLTACRVCMESELIVPATGVQTKTSLLARGWCIFCSVGLIDLNTNTQVLVFWEIFTCYVRTWTQMNMYVCGVNLPLLTVQ